MADVDGFAIRAPKSEVAAHEKLATWGKQLRTKHGASQNFECVADDLAVVPGCGLGL